MKMTMSVHMIVISLKCCFLTTGTDSDKESRLVIFVLRMMHLRSKYSENFTEKGAT